MLGVVAAELERVVQNLLVTSGDHGLDERVARDLLREELLEEQERIFYAIDARPEAVVVRTQLFSVLEARQVDVPRFNAALFVATTHLVEAARAYESKQGDIDDNVDADHVADAAAAADDDAVGDDVGPSGRFDKTGGRRALRGVPLRPLYKRLCRSLAYLLLAEQLPTMPYETSNVRDRLVDSTTKRLVSLPASSLLENLEIVSIHQYLAQVHQKLWEVGKVCALSDGAGATALNMPSLVGILGVENAVAVGAAVVKHLSERHIMALLGMRHTHATPQWAPPPSHAALYAVRWVNILIFCNARAELWIVFDSCSPIPSFTLALSFLLFCAHKGFHAAAIIGARNVPHCRRSCLGETLASGRK